MLGMMRDDAGEGEGKVACVMRCDVLLRSRLRVERPFEYSSLLATIRTSPTFYLCEILL